MNALHSEDHDELTGIPNRRAFLALLAGHVDQAVATKAALCLFCADIDYMKRFNAHKWTRPFSSASSASR